MTLVDGTGVRLAELIARDVAALGADRPGVVRIELGTLDLEDGQDESYVHARLVELLDAVRAAAPDAELTLVGFPATTSGLAETRRQCEASARVTAQLRGIRFEPAVSGRSRRPGARAPSG